MIHIDRFPEPETLTKYKEKWAKAFQESGKARPGSSQYAHPEIKACLQSMSHYKCFYCERKIKDTAQEIDHFIEVSEKPEMVFEWTNLYLSCDKCNNKRPNRIIPVAETLDPCKHSDAEIREHLTFEDEIITGRGGSSLGEKTIQKYQLDSEFLDRLRGKELKNFHKALIAIQRNQNFEGRKEMNEAERTLLIKFKQNTSPFSLMFTIILEQHGL